jgi:hypothetical protein
MSPGKLVDGAGRYAEDRGDFRHYERAFTTLNG